MLDILVFIARFSVDSNDASDASDITDDLFGDISELTDHDESSDVIVESSDSMSSVSSTAVSDMYQTTEPITTFDGKNIRVILCGWCQGYSICNDFDGFRQTTTILTYYNHEMHGLSCVFNCNDSELRLTNVDQYKHNYVTGISYGIQTNTLFNSYTHDEMGWHVTLYTGYVPSKYFERENHTKSEISYLSKFIDYRNNREITFHPDGNTILKIELKLLGKKYEWTDTSLQINDYMNRYEYYFHADKLVYRAFMAAKPMNIAWYK